MLKFILGGIDMYQSKYFKRRNLKKLSISALGIMVALVGSTSVVNAAPPLQGTGLILGDQEGHKNTAQATYPEQVSVAIGFDNTAINNGNSIGYNNESNTSGVAVGYKNVARSSGTAIGNNSVAIGGISIGSNATTGIANVATSPTHPNKYTQAPRSIALGNDAIAMAGTSLGYQTKTAENGLAVGAEATALYGGDAFGNSAKTEKSQFSLLRQEGVALGDNSLADRAYGSIGYVPLSTEAPGSLENSMQRDLALAEQTGNAKVQEVVKAFYDQYGSQYEAYETAIKERDANYTAVVEQKTLMNSTTYESENARQAALGVLSELQKKLDASNATIKELENSGIKSFMIKKDNYLGTWKATGGAVSVGRSAQYDENGELTRGPITRQITNVAAGTEDTDAVNVAQLKQFETMLTDASSWTLQSMDSTKKVTGKNTVKPQSTVNFISGAYTDVSVIGTDTETNVTIGLNTEAAKAIENVKNFITTDANGNNPRLNISGDNNISVTVDENGTTNITLKDKIKVSEITGLTNTSWDGKNYVTGRAATEDQLKLVSDTIAGIGNNINTDKATIGGNTTINEGGITINNPKTGNTTTITGDSITTTTVNADTVNTKVINSETVNTDKVVVGGNTYITKDGINANNQTITNVAPGRIAPDSTDAVNGSQLYAVDQKVNSVGSAVNRLSGRVDKVAAGSAALAALHPLDFDSDDKLNFAVGFGGYKGEHAAALGAFYRANDDVMFSLGATIGNSNDQYNAGVSFRFGDSSPYTNMSKSEMANTLEQQNQEIETLKDRLAKLEALVAQK